MQTIGIGEAVERGASMRHASQLLHVAFVLAIASLVSQSGRATAQEKPLEAQPPATKMEAFRPAAGTVVVLGYNDLGKVSGVSIDARQFRDARGSTVRGIRVEVTESQYREERSFVDSDEIPELLKGIDALLAVKSNPTSFQNFEVRYTTKGELQMTAFSSSRGVIQYAVRAGRVATAQAFLDEDEFRRLRALFESANSVLSDQASK